MNAPTLPAAELNALVATLKEIGHPPFRCSYYGRPKSRAQDALGGRTHYFDDGTLRFHKSRVHSFGVTSHGLLCWAIESCAKDFDNTSRGFRPVVFDVFGRVAVERRDLGNLLSSAAAARGDLVQVLAGIDLAKHYRAELVRRQAMMADQVAAIAGVVSRLVGDPLEGR